MKKNADRNQVYRSMTDYEKAFFPNSFNKQTDALRDSGQETGIALAKESLAKIKASVSKIKS